jgi:hypothetical protein
MGIRRKGRLEDMVCKLVYDMYDGPAICIGMEFGL